MLEVEPVGVELGDAAGGDDDAGRVAAKLDDVEGCEQGAAKGRREAVVGRRDPGEEVDAGRRLGRRDGAAGVRAQRGNGDTEEGLVGGHGCGVFSFLSLFVRPSFFGFVDIGWLLGIYVRVRMR